MVGEQLNDLEISLVFEIKKMSKKLVLIFLASSDNIKLSSF